MHSPLFLPHAGAANLPCSDAAPFVTASMVLVWRNQRWIFHSINTKHGLQDVSPAWNKYGYFEGIQVKFRECIVYAVAMPYIFTSSFRSLSTYIFTFFGSSFIFDLSHKWRFWLFLPRIVGGMPREFLLGSFCRVIPLNLVKMKKRLARVILLK